ncbi:hypothetical protein POM88_002236 [Heracleum sosnowskyi]|uniref:Uncharacterized protein n=1 Tax=Heracleum sosnowskyi TaxID=360622 RepID=A0AAD8NBL6_9APIA|nr:hypothetical protein POM88_002236 [Heracleum sosnowskyi]
MIQIQLYTERLRLRLYEREGRLASGDCDSANLRHGEVESRVIHGGELESRVKSSLLLQIEFGCQGLNSQRCAHVPILFPGPWIGNLECSRSRLQVFNVQNIAISSNLDFNVQDFYFPCGFLIL